MKSIRCRQNTDQLTQGETETKKKKGGTLHIHTRVYTVKFENYGCTYIWLIYFQYKETEFKRV